jgi:fumarate reductase flavoprotein subunit
MKGVAVVGTAAATTTLLAGCGGSAGSGNLPDKWDRETDVVVVGFGGAGAAAAIAAREAGAEVIVLEKRDVPGGSTAICGGIIYAANTSVQKANGIEDTADKMYEHYINAGKGFNDPELVRIAADQSAANVEQLIALGGEFSPPTVSGAEVNVGSEPIARSHTVAKYGELSGGAALFALLADGAKAAGAEILMETPGKELVVDADGVVSGVKAESAGEDLYIKARKGVILTAGGFTRNKEMLAAFTRDGFYSQPLGTPALDGDGHKMAFALGAATMNISEVLGIPGLTLPGAVSATYAFWTFIPTVAAILVNLEGRRFCDEFSFYDWKNTALLAQSEHYGFSVFDDATRQAAPGMIVMGFSEDLEAEVAAGTVLKADTLAELADKMGIPAARFEETVAKWNADVTAGADSEYGRTGGLGPIATAPFYAFATYSTMFDNSGGLKINTKAQVVDVWGNVISRLYAAGQIAGSVIGEHYPGSGSAINACLTFGRVAGQNAAAEEALK